MQEFRHRQPFVLYRKKSDSSNKKTLYIFRLMLAHVEEQELHGRIKVDIGF